MVKGTLIDLIYKSQKFCQIFVLNWLSRKKVLRRGIRKGLTERKIWDNMIFVFMENTIEDSRFYRRRHDE
jgi:hypothetical protein